MLYVKSINGKRIKDAEARTEIATLQADVNALQIMQQEMDADGYVDTPHLSNGAVTEVKVNSDFLKTIKNAYVTPEMFGAVGDGETDDTNAINSCLSYEAANIVLFTKQYLVTDTLNFSSDSILIGTENSAIISSNTERKPIFKGSNVSNIVIKGLNIEGNLQYDGLTDARENIECGLMFSGICSDILIENCKVTKCGQAGIYLHNTENVNIKNCYISYLEDPEGSFSENANYCFGIRTYDGAKRLLIENTEIFDVAIGVYLTHGGTDISVLNCFVHDISGQHAFYCATGEITIRDCIIKNIHTNALNLQYDNQSTASRYTKILNNIIENSNNAIAINNIVDTTMVFDNILVDGNKLTGNRYGIYFKCSKNAKFTNNVIEACGRTGIYAVGVNENTEISNNVIRNSGQDSVQSYQYGIHLVGGTAPIIKNNIISNDDEKMPYGVFAYADVTGLLMIGNIIKGATLYSSRFLDLASLELYSDNYTDKTTQPAILNAAGFVNSLFSKQAAPTDGYHQRGEISFNTEPAAGGNVGWICVTSGTPGTWKSFGAIDS